MIDIEQIRRQPEDFKDAIAAKGIPLNLEELLQIDEQRRTVSREVNRLREQRNRITELVATNPDNRHVYIAESRAVGQELAGREVELRTVESEYARLMGLVPSIPCDGTPAGVTDEDNLEIRRVGEPARRTIKQRDHIELATIHGMADFEGARQAAGSRAYALVGNGALLELAVLRFAFDRLLAKGFIPVLPPLLVNSAAMFGTGYFPLGEDNAYELERDKLFLTGTSEVGLVSMHMSQTLELADLPRRYIGISPCFRREAGAAG